MTDNNWPETGPSTKFFLIVGLFLASLIPGIFISGLINEREQRQTELIPDFAASWGPPQTLSGPVLVIPYQAAPNGPRQYLKVGAEKLEIAASLTTEDRRRGLFHASVYDASVRMQGTVRLPSQARLGVLVPDKSIRLLWEESFISVSLTSRAGMRAGDRLTWNGQEAAFLNCRELAPADECPLDGLLLARPPGAAALQADMDIPFQIILDFRGTGSLYLTSSARQFDAVVGGPWTTPSFSGSVLPVSSQIGGKGFEAHWQSFQSGAQSWVTPRFVEPTQAMAKIDLLEAVPIYRMIHRASKYTALFIALAYASYLLFDLLSGIRIHLLQYGLMSLSLALFSLLLLSLAEWLGYDLGFLLGSLMVIVQASLYTWSVTRKGRETALFAALLSLLFGFLYVLLSLETYSLLVGSLALFVVLSSLMALTSRIKWGSR